MARANILLVVVVAMMLVVAAVARAEPINVDSPDGSVRLTISLDAPRATFAVAHRGAAVIEPSPLVFTVDGVDLTIGAQSGTIEPYAVDETYDTRGVHSKATNRCKGAKIPITHKPSGQAFALDARAYNDGVAFRFIIPGGESSSRVPDETTTFAIPSGSTVWYHGMRGHYEDDYAKKDIAEVTPGEWAAPPLTFKLPGGGGGGGGYASITEAGLVNYSGFALEADGRRGMKIGLGHRQPVSYPYELRYPKEDVARLSHPAAVKGTITTPWRVVLVGDLNALVNSDIISNLAAPPDEKLFPKGVHTDWVKPGRAVWRYLDNERQRPPTTGAAAAPAQAGAAPADPLPAAQTQPVQQRRPGGGGGGPGGQGVPTDEAKTFSRLAGQLGFEYNILEGFWARWTDEQLREVVNYSKEQGVGIWVWVHSRRLYDPANRAALFKRCRDFGIAGLKIDFFDHEHKDVIDLYHALLREAAESKVLLNFHGANKPAGESRTWPNELVREAVRGMEASRMTNRAQHNATIPFTRFLAGHAEYTVTIFHDRRADTTWAHQIATAAVFTAPLLTYAAHPQKLLDHPASDMIKSIPSTWDETRVLPGSGVGECAALARRKGDAWFVAIINGPSERTLEVVLTFLDDGEYRCSIVRDRANEPAGVEIESARVQREKTLTVPLVPGGGYIARFTK